MLLVASRTHKGLIRAGNEDSLYAPEGVPEGLILVADGMGGHNAGEVASAVAMETVVNEIRAMRQGEPMPVQEMVRLAVRQANRAILRHSATNADYSGMGTTLTMALNSASGEWTIGHVGDSRAYHLSKDGLRRVTRDHTLLEELLRIGELTPEEAEDFPQRHVITRALGTGASVRVDLTHVELLPGEGLLLCSDGLTDHIRDSEIEQVFYRSGTPDDCAENLLSMCLGRGAHDNVSIVVLVDGDGK